ncbi:hypothetical protein [Laceyella putida]|uniref:Sporulation protein Cse60 n=1 Tax=Laceyella putida TaxID=110101 RepID=A0ABW2RQG2_9BACL
MGKFRSLVAEGKSRSELEDNINFQLGYLRDDDEVITVDVHKEKDKYLAVIIYEKA